MVSLTNGAECACVLASEHRKVGRDKVGHLSALVLGYRRRAPPGFGRASAASWPGRLNDALSTQSETEEFASIGSLMKTLYGSSA
jgi:hypothetical protein